MVVVLDAFESEKVVFDYGDEDLAEISQPLLDSRRNSNTPETDGKRRNKKWVLSQRGQWCLRACSALAIVAIVLVNFLGAKGRPKGSTLINSIVEDSSSENGLGCISVMLNPEKAEKIFL